MSALLRLTLLAIVTIAASPATAHLTPNSEIGLEIGRDRIEASLLVPLGELEYAEPEFTGLRTGAIAPANIRRIRAYLQHHVSARAPDGRSWAVNVRDVRIADEASPDLTARVTLTPPPGAPVRNLLFRYDAVLDRVPNHFALLLLKSDFEAGHLSEHPELLGGLRQGRETLDIDRGPGSAWRGFAAAIGLGMHHIAEGHDHLLFLIVLLLPAPLMAAGRRWAGYAGWRRTLGSLAMIVTAFTIGHSVTLIGGAFFDWQLPARPVEILIALSILISAVHAWRPLFAGREALVAGGFGLVHGLAFATIIGHFGLDPWQKAQSILGFNLGIELVQLTVVAAVAPGLILLAQSSRYGRYRSIAAGLSGMAAIFWIIERATGEAFAPAQLVDMALGYAPWLFALGLLLSAIVHGRRRFSSASRTS